MDRNDKLDVDRTDKLKATAGDSRVIHHDDNPSHGDEAGEAAGGISGVLAGAAIGSVGGPIGTVIGGIAGAIGGWWAGRSVSEAASRLTHDDDNFYKSQYETSATSGTKRSYDDVRPAYHLGHIAGHNPDYSSRNFDAVEGDLQKGWTKDMQGKSGDWNSVRDYARQGFERGRTGSAKPGAASTAGAAAATTSYYGGRAATAAGNAANKVENATENAWERTKNVASSAGNKVADKADDMKDRVDGNPASKPGPDATDSSRRL